jgi:hypothetical protein
MMIEAWEAEPEVIDALVVSFLEDVGTATSAR